VSTDFVDGEPTGTVCIHRLRVVGVNEVGTVLRHRLSARELNYGVVGGTNNFNKFYR